MCAHALALENGASSTNDAHVRPKQRVLSAASQRLPFVRKRRSLLRDTTYLHCVSPPRSLSKGRRPESFLLGWRAHAARRLAAFSSQRVLDATPSTLDTLNLRNKAASHTSAASWKAPPAARVKRRRFCILFARSRQRAVSSRRVAGTLPFQGGSKYLGALTERARQRRRTRR